MSAVPPKADISVMRGHACFGPNTTSVERSRLSVNSSPLERGLSGSHRVETMRMAWMTIGALSIMMLCPECVSVMCIAPGTSAASSF